MNSKQDKGVTLIALIITIIVLLILAGIAFSSLTGNDGILKKASDAAEVSRNAEANQEETLRGYENKIDKWLDITANEEDTIEKIIGKVRPAIPTTVSVELRENFSTPASGKFIASTEIIRK